MRNKFNLVIILFLLFIIISCGNDNIVSEDDNQNQKVRAQKPFPQHIQYREGIIKPNDKTQEEIDNSVKTFYKEWKKQYLKEVTNEKGPDGGKVYKIIMNPSGRTVSEGQGYGMVIIALMAGYEEGAKDIFDGLWYFVRNHKSNIDNRLMAWEVPEPSGGADSAFDGDCDIAYSLLLADKQWGSSGNINYLEEAKTYIKAIYESTIGKESYLPLLGDWVEEDGDVYNQYTPRTSDFMLVNFKGFKKAVNNERWDNVINSVYRTIDFIQKNYSATTGLLPDFLEGNGSLNTLRPADPEFLEGPYDGDYYYNAGRDPWRIGLDAILYNNSNSKRAIKRVLDWIYKETGGNPYKVFSGYHLNGKPLKGSDYFTTFFVAPFGVAAMNDSSKQEFLNKIFEIVSKKHEGYYEDTITLISLIIMSGNYWTY